MMHTFTMKTGKRFRPAECRLVQRVMATVLRSLVSAAVGCGLSGASYAAPINIVLDTGTNTPLPSRVTSNGAPTTIVGPSNPTATINGVTIRYLGTELVSPIVSDPFNTGSTATGVAGKFFVSGDLTLNSDQKIFGIGPNLVKLEVGNNATLAAGSVIDVSGEGRTNGAGGGAGGNASPSGLTGLNPFYSVIGQNGPEGAQGGFGGNTFFAGGINGTNGQTSTGQAYLRPFANITYFPGTSEYTNLFRSVAGGAGAIGQGNVGSAPGGIETPYTGPFATQGAGGPGGAAGNGSGPFGGPVFGVSGGNGGLGGNGPQGMSGAHAGPIQEQLNPAAVYLRGGNGGGAGATGGDGLPGGWGGGGGGGGATSADTSGNRNDGGNGGDGGLSGLGGIAGAGGLGGGGGGGLQLLVRGTLNFSGNVAAAGGNAGQGQAGAFGALGEAGKAGVFRDTLGSNGGNGGSGGTGGRGGTGGNGRGGSGGVVQIVSSNLGTLNGSTTTLGGLAGDGVTRSAQGATYLHAYSGPGAPLSTNTYFGVRAAGENPYRSHTETFTFGGPPVGQFANVPAIIGGAAPYGMLVGNGLGDVASGVEAFGGLAAPPAAPGHIRVGAVSRVSASWLANQYGMTQFNANDQELLLFSAFEPNLPKPALMSVDSSHSPFLDYIPAGPLRLRAGNGYLNDPSLTPDAVAPTDMANLPSRSTFAMYTAGTQNVTASFAPYGTPRNFRGTPTAGNFGSPGASTVFLEDRGFLFLGISGLSTTTGRGAAAFIEEEANGEYGAGLAVFNVRAGGGALVTAAIDGSGNTGTATSGSVTLRTLQPPTIPSAETGPLYAHSTQHYSQIGVGGHWDSTGIPLYTKNLPIGTKQRVGDVIHSPEYDADPRAISISLDANVFGPSPVIKGAGTSNTTFDFPATQVGESTSASFDLMNADILSPINSIWRFTIQQSPELIRLSVLGYELIDPSGVFSVASLPTSFVLNGNQSQTINVGFNPTTAGNYAAQLRLLTDVNAEVGQPGDYFTISLSGAAGAAGAACDLNLDGAIDAADAGIMFGDWGSTSPSPADKNQDGIVDAADAGILFADWTGDTRPLSVPEPSSSLLALLVTVGTFSMYRQRGDYRG